MIKQFVSWFAIVLFILFVFLILVSNAQAADKTFTITINSQQVTVKLPGILPSMKTAIFAGEKCFNLTVCRQQFCLNLIPGHDHIDFVYTDKGEVVALVWIKTREKQMVAWKYVAGEPILSTIQEIVDIITQPKKLKEVSGLPI